MRRHITLWKPVGATPLETVEGWRRLQPELTHTPLTYAGRLDPMADGKLLVLIGEECKRQRAYMGLDKEYEVDVLFGFESDTSDILGLIKRNPLATHPEEHEVQRALAKECGTKRLPYPAFSSKTVGGVPLFMHALEGTLATIEIPTHDETIYRATLLRSRTVAATNLLKDIEARIAKVTYDPDQRKSMGADFRRADIRERWKKALDDSNETYVIARIRVTAASGTYMRSLAARLGNSLGTNALAFSITRTRIGRYQRLGPWGFWRHSY